MATHFARGTLSQGQYFSAHLSVQVMKASRLLPGHKRARFLASRGLLAELMFMLYGVPELPDIAQDERQRPHFIDSALPDFSIAYAGNIVGVLIATEGRCGLDMELQRGAASVATGGFTSNETIWINNQADPREARVQIRTLRQSLGKLIGQPEDVAPHLQLLPGVGRLRFGPMPMVEAICDAEEILIWSIAATPAAERLKIWSLDNVEGWSVLRDVQARSQDPDTRLMRFTTMPGDKAMIIDQV